MFRLNGLLGGVRQAIRNAGSPVVRSARSGEKEETEEGFKEGPAPEHQEGAPVGVSTGIGGCMGALGTAATIAAAREMMHLARDSPFGRGEETGKDEGSGWLSSLNSLTTKAWNQPTLISAHRVLPVHSLLPDTPHSSIDASVQTEPEPSTSQAEEVEGLKEAETEFRSAIRHYESTVHNWIGVDLVRQGLFGEAFKYFHRATTAGHFKAKYNLGMCYYKGYGTTSNIAKAAELWREAGEGGHGTALYQLGVCYVRGLGVAKDPDKGWDLIHRAALLNVPDAQRSRRHTQEDWGKGNSVKFRVGSESGGEEVEASSSSSSRESVVFKDDSSRPVNDTHFRLGIQRSRTIHDFRSSSIQR